MRVRESIGLLLVALLCALFAKGGDSLASETGLKGQVTIVSVTQDSDGIWWLGLEISLKNVGDTYLSAIHLNVDRVKLQPQQGTGTFITDAIAAGETLVISTGLGTPLAPEFLSEQPLHLIGEALNADAQIVFLEAWLPILQSWSQQ